MHRALVVLTLSLLAASCGGAPPSQPPPPAAQATDPATPSPPVPPPPLGASGSARLQLGAAQGLYVVEASQAGPSVQGVVTVTAGPGTAVLPADTTVTMNGVPLVRDPQLGGGQWRLDGAGPQPAVASGGTMVLVASATLDGQLEQHTLVLECPQDATVASTPAAGAALAAGTLLHLASLADLGLAAGSSLPAGAGVHAAATFYGFDPATAVIVPAGAAAAVPPGPLALALVVPTLPAGSRFSPGSTPEYLLDLRWPGRWFADGAGGAFCGLAKRWTYAR